MGNHHLHTKEFIVGTAVGSVLGSVTALLIAPKTGKKLREDICDTYCSMADKTQDLADRGKSLAKDVSCHTCDWADKAKSLMEGATKRVKGWVSEEEEEETTRDLLIGVLVGGVLGAAAGLLLAPKSGNALRQDLAETYEDLSEKTQDFTNNLTKKGRSLGKTASLKTNKWLDLAKDVLSDLTEGAQETGEEWVGQVKGLVNNKKISDVLDWALLGYRVWQGRQSKKR